MVQNAKLRVSLITTERNEVETIEEFIKSALAQSRPADEIIIADGGSTDGTLEIIDHYTKKGGPIKLVKAPGNRSVGRNAATSAATSEIIACTDVGSRLDRDWLRYITQPFADDPATMAVAGNFKAAPQTDFERISATLMLQGNDEIDLATWLPSSRSIAYKKSAWAKVGGYPERTNFNEDTPFDLALKQAGYSFADGLAAIVYWRPRPNLRQFYRQYNFYAIGDGLDRINAGGIARLTAIYLVLAVSVIILAVIDPILILVPVLFVLLWVLRRVYGGFKKLPTLKSALLMPILMVTYDLSQIFGYWKGVLGSERLKSKDHLVR